MHRRSILIAILLLPLVFIVAASDASAAPAAPGAPGAPGAPPNVVLIISDDQAWTDYSFMGHDVIKTPRLDRLASESFVFTRGYVPGSLCRPSLASMVTGLYPWQHGIAGNDPSPPKGAKGPGWRVKSPEYLALREKLVSHIEDAPTLPRMLKAKDFVSHQSGKWWEGHYSRGGFTHGMTHGDPKRGGRHGDEGLKIGRDGMEPVFDFIDTAQKDGKPFFVWYAPFLPHTPHNPPQRLLDKYKDKVDSIHVAKYYAMCEWFDETCGQLLDHLDKRGLAKDTLVIYVTDNGWINRDDRSAYAPRSKRSPYDGGLRTPIMLRWPGRIAPKMDKQTLAMSIDIAPTVLAACGIEPPKLSKEKRMQGVNLLELCADGFKDANGRAAKRDIIFGDNHLHDQPDVNDPMSNLAQRWCIRGQYKLILPHENNEPGEVALFDILADPFEKNNLAKEKPAVVKELTNEIDSWLPVK